jgi:hypothetical protein
VTRALLPRIGESVTASSSPFTVKPAGGDRVAGHKLLVRMNVHASKERDGDKDSEEKRVDMQRLGEVVRHSVTRGMARRTWGDGGLG